MNLNTRAIPSPWRQAIPLQPLARSSSPPWPSLVLLVAPGRATARRYTTIPAHLRYPWMKLIVAPPPAYIRIRFWMRLPLRHAGGAVVTRQVSYFIAQCVGLNILLNLLNFLPTFLPFCQSSPSREADEQLPTSYGCIRLANDVGIGGVGRRPHCNLASGDVILLLTHWPTPWP